MSIKTTMPPQRIALYILSALSALAIGLFSANPDFGTPDFQEYWSALRLFEKGIDPYIPAHMSEFQRASFGRETPIMMWNPPWLLTLMYPLLQFDFLVSARLWLLAQLVMIGASVMIAVSLLRSVSLSPAGYLCILVASVSFPPCCNSLRVGQIGALLLFGGSIVFWGLARHSSWAIAFGCAILSVKPHLFLLFGVVLLWWIVTEKRYSLVMQIGFVITGLALFSELIMPRSFGYWLESFGYRGSDIVPSKLQWVGNIWGVPFLKRWC